MPASYINIYIDSKGRFISDEEYSTKEDAAFNADPTGNKIETVAIVRGSCSNCVHWWKPELKSEILGTCQRIGREGAKMELDDPYIAMGTHSSFFCSEHTLKED